MTSQPYPHTSETGGPHPDVIGEYTTQPILIDGRSEENNFRLKDPLKVYIVQVFAYRLICRKSFF